MMIFHLFTDRCTYPHLDLGFTFSMTMIGGGGGGGGCVCAREKVESVGRISAFWDIYERGVLSRGN
jgi:hypothetical protein